jgi:hypothetical protein
MKKIIKETPEKLHSEFGDPIICRSSQALSLPKANARLNNCRLLKQGAEEIRSFVC